MLATGASTTIGQLTDVGVLACAPGTRLLRLAAPARDECGWAAAVAGTSTIASEVVTDMTVTFAVTWDYRCPFARNAHEHILTGLAAGADWQVRFLPFSLGQVHVAEGEPSVWDKPDQDTGILALQAGVIVRDEFAGQFPAVHRALFAARHDEGLQLEDRGVVKRILAEHGVTTATVFARIDSGAALASVQTEHEQFARSHNVWGVPTFIAGEQAVFIRFMHRAPLGADPTASIQTIERTLELVTEWVDLNEFKHTTIPR